MPLPVRLVGPAILVTVCTVMGCGRLGYDPIDDSQARRYVVPSASVRWTAGAVSLDDALADARPGDTIVVAPGVYDSLAPTVSGEPGAPIRIVSEVDGAAVFDGAGVRVPCRFENVHHLEVVGIRCINMGDDPAVDEPAVLSVYRSANLRFERVSAYDATIDRPVVSVFQSADIDLQDAAGAGRGKYMFALQESDRLVLRGCYAHGFEGPALSVLIWIRGTNDSLVEGCVARVEPGVADGYFGIVLSSGDEAPRADDNTVAGNVVIGATHWAYEVISDHRIAGNRFVDDVAVDSRLGFFARADVSLAVEHLTLASIDESAFSVNPSSAAKAEDFALGGALHDSVIQKAESGVQIDEDDPFMLGFAHTHNAWFDVTTPFVAPTVADATELERDPSFGEADRGIGAYLVAPAVLSGLGRNGGDLGADALQYMTFPWPMEERIESELGVSVTWEAKGGLFRTLDGLATDQSAQ